MSFNRLILLITLVFTLPSYATESPFFTTFLDNLEKELALAREQGKKGVMIFFSTPVCPFCHRMKKTVLIKKQVQTFFQTNFRLLEMNIVDTRTLKDFSGHNTTQHKFAQEHRIRVTPTMIFYDLQGEPLFRQVGIVANSQEFIWLGEYILQEGYTRDSFSHYKREKRTIHR